jgi:hypothetical protein
MPSIASVGRDIPGDRWIAMGPGEKQLAWAYLHVRLDGLLADHGARAVSEVEELVRYDEKGRRVQMFVEVHTEPVED